MDAAADHSRQERSELRARTDAELRDRQIQAERHTEQRSHSCERSYRVPERRVDDRLYQPSVNLLFSDASYAPPIIYGASTQDAERWLRRFTYYVQFRQMNETAALQLFKLLMTDAAADWLESVNTKDKLTTKSLIAAFTERFASSDIFRWQQASAIFARKQGDSEAVDTYITDILNLAKKVPISDENIIRFALIKGFHPAIPTWPICK